MEGLAASRPRWPEVELATAVLHWGSSFLILREAPGTTQEPRPAEEAFGPCITRSGNPRPVCAISSELRAISLGLLLHYRSGGGTDAYSRRRMAVALRVHAVRVVAETYAGG